MENPKRETFEVERERWKTLKVDKAQGVDWHWCLDTPGVVLLENTCAWKSGKDSTRKNERWSKLQKNQSGFSFGITVHLFYSAVVFSQFHSYCGY